MLKKLNTFGEFSPQRERGKRQVFAFEINNWHPWAGGMLRGGSASAPRNLQTRESGIVFLPAHHFVAAFLEIHSKDLKLGSS